jgi:ribosome-associated translation inhibitor RaiA
MLTTSSVFGASTSQKFDRPEQHSLSSFKLINFRRNLPHSSTAVVCAKMAIPNSSILAAASQLNEMIAKTKEKIKDHHDGPVFDRLETVLPS